MQRTLLIFLFLSFFLETSLLAQYMETSTRGEQKSLESIMRGTNANASRRLAKLTILKNEALVRGETTDGVGIYLFTNIPTGTYQINASYWGYHFGDMTHAKIEETDVDFAELELRVKDRVFLPIVSIGLNIDLQTRQIITGYGLAPATEDLMPKQNKPAEIDIRSKPGPAERNPFDSPIDLLLYPNPTSGLISITLEYEQLDIQLINTIGQVLGAISFDEVEKNKVQIDLSAYAAGTYFLNITHESGTQIEKVVLVHL